MKRILLLLIALTVAAVAGWYYWNFFQKISSAPLAALLPQETIFVANVPDFNSAGMNGSIPIYTSLPRACSAGLFA